MNFGDFGCKMLCETPEMCEMCEGGEVREWAGSCISNSRELFVLLYTAMVWGAWKARRVSCLSLKIARKAKA